MLNGLMFDEIPKEIHHLNDYEKVLLIQHTKPFQVVLKMKPVAPPSHLINKVLGFTFYLPLPLQETLHDCQLLISQSLSMESCLYNSVLYLLQKVVWENIVDAT